MSQIRKSDIDGTLFLERVKQAGSLRRLAAMLRMPAGTLSAIASGTRGPNASHRRKLIKAGLMQSTSPCKPRIPWKRVSLILAGSMVSLRDALSVVGVSPERVEEIVTAYYQSEEAR